MPGCLAEHRQAGITRKASQNVVSPDRFAASGAYAGQGRGLHRRISRTPGQAPGGTRRCRARSGRLRKSGTQNGSSRQSYPSSLPDFCNCQLYRVYLKSTEYICFVRWLTGSAMWTGLLLNVH